MAFVTYTALVFVGSAIFGAAYTYHVNEKKLASVGIERIEQRNVYVDGKLVSVSNRIVWLGKHDSTEVNPIAYKDTVWTNGDFSVDFGNCQK